MFMTNTESILKETQERFAKTIENFKNSISGLSTKATPAIFNAIRVEAYGSETPISQVASINVSDSKTMMVRVHDASLAGNVSKAIQSANLGVSVVMEGSSIRVVMPPMSEERRKSTSNLVNKALEDAKVSVRNIRRDQNDELKKGLKDKVFSEDAVKKIEEKIQKLTDECTKNLESLSKIKVDEIMSF
jgi:ribosome recycling factor